MAFRVAITLSSLPPSFTRPCNPLPRVSLHADLGLFILRDLCAACENAQRNRYVPYGAHATCLMPHAPCPMRGNDIRGKRTCFGCAFFGPKWAGQMELESSHDWWSTDGRKDRGRDRQTEHTHTHTRTHKLRLRLRLRWTDSCDDADLSPHWHSHLCNYTRCTHTLRHTHRLTGKNISQSNRCPTCPTSSRACNYFLLNLHHMRNMSKT